MKYTNLDARLALAKQQLAKAQEQLEKIGEATCTAEQLIVLLDTLKTVTKEKLPALANLLTCISYDEPSMVLDEIDDRHRLWWTYIRARWAVAIVAWKMAVLRGQPDLSLEAILSEVSRPVMPWEQTPDALSS